MNENFSNRVKGMVDELDKVLVSYNAELVEEATAPLSDVLDDIRELIQQNLAGAAQRVIRKLRSNQDLSYDDLRTIQKWIVGDAEYYAKMENNMMDWVGECRRLCHVLSDFSYENIEQDDARLFTLAALLTDLKHTLYDVARYSEAMNRADRFKETIGRGQIDQQTRRWLADLMERQLYSSEY